jgi:serine/threonine protein kinase/Tfp pilus assembly protein PilF
MSTHHQRAKDIFLAALAVSPTRRGAFVMEVCAADAALREEVESLLTFHDEDDEAAETAKTEFAPGTVFASRYRMTRRIGHGGMGDVWEADDLVLETAVALKLIDSTDAPARERILTEVRLARQITHPAVCRVFDVGDADGAVFYSMELVRGEDLAALLRRAGRLPSEKVVEIARQLCAGLAAAHAQGVIHRDLKPANILVDDDGLVRITDFGIAIARADAGLHMQTGTPRYMAPEQRAEGTPISEQTDVYALGLVLYELLVGPDAFSRAASAGALPRPSMLVPAVDPQLERVVTRALSQDPGKRQASAAEMAAGLPNWPGTGQMPSPLRWTTAPRWVAAATLAGIVGIMAVASSYFVLPAARTLTERDTIMLADFDNTTGEPVFDGTLKVALAVSLEQSPFLKVFPDERARETLRLMERSPDERITHAVAREIARREQLKALLTGSIAKLGRNYVLTLEAINAATGDVMAREQAEAASKEDVLTSLGGATSRIREKLGESLASVQKFDVPLPRATTDSLDALHAYSLALSGGAEVPRLEAIPPLKRALEIDPTFAMAHAFLSGVYANTGQSGLAPQFSRRAFELRNRVSERERFFISWRYYRDAAQDWEKARELAQAWTVTYPREAFAFNSLGSADIRLGRYAQSVGAFRESIRLDPQFIPAYGNLAAALMAIDQYGEARAVLEQAAERKLEFNGAHRLSYFLAVVQGDAATMAREFDASVGVDKNNAAFGWQARSSAFSGRVMAAHEQFGRGIQLSLQGSFAEVAAQLTMEDAETHAVVGQCDEARREVTSGLGLGRDNATVERASRVLALCGDARDAISLSSDVARRFPDATFTNGVSVPVTAAALALAQRDPARARVLLEPVRRYDHAPSAEFWPAYLRGQAYLQLKDGPAAAAEFRSILDHRGEVPVSVLYPLAHLGRARAAAITSDVETARKSYEAFFAAWDAADADLQPLKEARLEYARLEGAPRATSE